MNDQANKDAARAYFEDLLNAGERATADSIFAADVRFHYPLGELEGTAEVKGYIAAVKSAFPDIRFAVEDLFAEGDRVAARWTLTGTQTGEFRGNPPTGKRVHVPGNTIFHLREGRIREMWIAFNPSLLV